MKVRIIYILLLVAFLSSCSEDFFLESSRNRGGKVAVEFSLNVPKTQEVLTRALGNKMDTPTEWAKLNVYLVVFDKNGFWIETVEAENKKEGTDEVTFTALLTPSDEPRIVHFVANYPDIDDLRKTGVHESNLMTSLSVNQDVYWKRVELTSIKDAGTHDDGSSNNNGIIEPSNTFTKVPLVRNFAQIQIENAAASLDADKGRFTITGYVLYHKPTTGTIAPFNMRNGKGEFVTYEKDGDNGKVSKSYSEFLKENYQGVTPTDVVYEDQKEVEITDQNNIPASYLFETPNATGSNKGQTFIVVKGYMGDNSNEVKYHKIDLIYYADKDGYPVTTDKISTDAVDIKYYNLLRNLKYTVKIESVTGGGYDSADEAAKHAASNNVYASIQTSEVTNIGDAQQRLYVENTYILCTTPQKDTEVKIGYKYLSTDNDWKNSTVTVGCDKDKEYIVGLTLSDNDASITTEHWSYATLKLKEDLTESQTINVHFYVRNNEEIISRDVAVVFCKPYKLEVKCMNSLNKTKTVAKSVGQGVEVDIFIPKGLPQQIFPLSFNIETEGNTIYPNVEDNTALGLNKNNLPVSVNSNKSFVYTKVLTYDDYSQKTNNVEEDGESIKVRCYFRTNCEDNAASVSVSNVYFSPYPDELSQYPTGTPADDYFENPGGATIKGLTLSGAQYYGTGQTVTLNISAADASKSLTIKIYEDNVLKVTKNVSGSTSYTETYTTQTFCGKITAVVSVDGTDEYISANPIRNTLKKPIFTATGDGLSKNYSYRSGWNSRTYSYSASNQIVTIKKGNSSIGSGTISTSGFVSDVVVGEGLNESDNLTLEYSFTPTYTRGRWTENGTTQTRTVTTTLSVLLSGTTTLNFTE